MRNFYTIDDSFILKIEILADSIVGGEDGYEVKNHGFKSKKFIDSLPKFNSFGEASQYLLDERLKYNKNFNCNLPLTYKFVPEQNQFNRKNIVHVTMRFNK